MAAPAASDSADFIALGDEIGREPAWEPSERVIQARTIALSDEIGREPAWEPSGRVIQA